MLAREFRHPLFLILAALYGLSRWHRFAGLALLPAPVNSYLADVACLPLELTVALVLLRRSYFRRPAFVLPVSWIVSAWLLTFGWFELLLPHLRPSATADPLDGLAYAAGGLLFWRWLNRPG
ncbi:hypothetical protein SAMN02745146_2653 [Hymenobacter daecheongensis DSM 21074]|uniref:Magnesium citrate secondary transporter n=2 Tax=Hymenobacter daecheongensis TaxID=496053 RepID=A0A1M6HUV0_9BACT|nr:hypothetical protein SAMN02745146_2653 [Hymenobacter daecheongensis DSM 21074]